MVNIELTGDITGRAVLFAHKFAIMQISRKSKAMDTIYILDDFEHLEVGTVVNLKGEVVTKKFNKDTRKMWFVKVIEYAVVEKGWRNEISALVTVSNDLKIRSTPLGKKVVEVSLNCPDNKCYVYAIAFNDYAEEIYNTIVKGDVVKLTGRLQSREYGEEPKKMVNEILIYTIEKTS